MRSLGLLLLVACNAALASSPIVSQDFEGGESGWITMGTAASVHTTHDPANVKGGKASLQFDYTAGKGMSIAVFPLRDVSLAGMKTLRFWLKTESATAIAVLLSEKDDMGGRYSSIVWSPKGQWQHVELTPSDFHLAEGPNDPKDADGKLDLDQLTAVSLIDLSQMLNTDKDGESAPIWRDSHSGAQKLWIDDFEALDTASAAGPVSKADGTLIDNFGRPQLAWLTLGGVDLTLDESGGPLKQRAMKASYQQTEGRFVLITRPGRLALGKANRLAFDIASDAPAHLVISLEELAPGADQGPRYNVDIDVPGGKSDHRELDLAAFQLDENGLKDSNGKLDLDRIKALSIVDVTAAYTQETAKNTLWIGDIRAVSRP